MTPRLVSLAFLLLLSLPALAQRNELAVSFGRSEFDSLGDGPAFGLSYNRFWTDSVSTRFALFAAADEANVGNGEDIVSAYYATAEYHFLRGRRISPFAGLGLAFAFVSIDRVGGNSEGDSGFAPVIIGGVDVNITRRFALGADVTYLQFEADLDDRFATALDPTTVLVSAKFRY
jgi:outer membrane protein W